MTIRKTLLLLTGLSFSIPTFSQDEIQIDILPGKVLRDIKMIIPSGQYFIFERYHNFKSNYWISATDTLVKLDNGLLQGRNVTISPGTFSIKANKCDTTINKIRNSALDHKLFSALDHIARKQIGHGNQKFNSFVNNEKPTQQQVANLCHDDFKVLITKWFDIQTENIDAIKKEKILRLEKIRSNADNIDREFIRSFLNDYGACETDHTAALELIEKYPDDFLTVCKELSDLDFFSVKLNLSLLSDNLKPDEAIAKLKASPIRTNRKGKLIRKLNKSTRRQNG